MRNSHQYMSFKGRDTSTSWQELQCLLLALHHCVFQATGLCFQFPVISVPKENHEMESRGGGGHHFVSHTTRFTNRIGSDLAHVPKLMDFRYWLHRPFLKDSEIISGQKKKLEFLSNIWQFSRKRGCQLPGRNFPAQSLVAVKRVGSVIHQTSVQRHSSTTYKFRHSRKLTSPP